MSEDEDQVVLAGGSMYHDAGFAGLRPSEHPQAGLLNKEQNVASSGISEVPDIIDDAASLSPSRIAGFLLLK